MELTKFKLNFDDLGCQVPLKLETHFSAIASKIICQVCTPYNVGSLITVEVVQYIGGCSVHRGDNVSTVGR